EPAWRETPANRATCFNPRSRTGANQWVKETPDEIFVSIHAPARERTRTVSSSPTTNSFQSTLPHGSERFPLAASMPSLAFQSTLPHGSERMIVSTHAYGGKFQSTLPHGSERSCASRVRQGRMFQSTLPH